MAGKARQQHLAAGKTVIYRYAAIYPIARLPRRSTTEAGVCGEHRRQVFPYFLIFSHILPYSPIKKAAIYPTARECGEPAYSMVLYADRLCAAR